MLEVELHGNCPPRWATWATVSGESRNCPERVLSLVCFYSKKGSKHPKQLAGDNSVKKTWIIQLRDCALHCNISQQHWTYGEVEKRINNWFLCYSMTHARHSWWECSELSKKKKVMENSLFSSNFRVQGSVNALLDLSCYYPRISILRSWQDVGAPILFSTFFGR